MWALSALFRVARLSVFCSCFLFILSDWIAASVRLQPETQEWEEKEGTSKMIVSVAVHLLSIACVGHHYAMILLLLTIDFSRMGKN